MIGIRTYPGSVTKNVNRDFIDDELIREKLSGVDSVMANLPRMIPGNMGALLQFRQTTRSLQRKDALRGAFREL